MKLRKILSIILAASVLGTLMIPAAMADDTNLFNETYDMTKVKADKENGVVKEIEVPDGDYKVTVTTGGKTETKANVYINGGERVRAYTLEAGKTQENEQPVVPKDGKITVQVIGDAPNVTEIKVEQLAAREKAEKPTIYIAGDSTAQTYNYEKAYPQTGWGQVFGDYLTDGIALENRSMAGRSSKSYNNDGRLDRILTEMHPGDYVFIQFGINDGDVNKPERYISVEDYKDLIINKYMGEVTKRGGTPVLMTANAASWWDEEKGNFMESRADYADPTREIAAETGCAFVDANRIETDMWNLMEKQDVLDGYFICEPFESKAYPVGTDDHTHLKQKGAKRIAAAIAQALLDDVPVLAPYINIGSDKFIDVANHWAEEYIKKAYQLDLVAGQGEGKFNPDANVTRAEFLKMAMDASGIVGHAYREGECLDATNEDWYCYYLQGAMDKGLVHPWMLNVGVHWETKVISEATEDKEEVVTYILAWDYDPNASYTVQPGFKGDSAITREEMAAIAMNCISYALRNTEKPIDLTADNSDVAEFTDGADINEVYKNAVEAAVSYGVINGMGDGTFAPKANLTRAQATVIITKLADMLET
ncbi:MAG: S-layer homology domain-containing protein, partial [Clostridia bacterium]|nr:S-layer homology domain-containing protein [Clostridia bacterium]